MRYKNIFLTGEIAIGKSTIINKFIQSLDKTVNLKGFKTLEIYNNDKVYGYYIDNKSLREDLKGKCLEKIDTNCIIGVKNYKKKICIPFMDTFNNEGVEILKDSLSADLIIMDELGFLEKNSEDFKKYIYKILDSNTPTLGVIKKKKNSFLESIINRKDVLILEVTRDNRDYIIEEIHINFEKYF